MPRESGASSTFVASIFVAMSTGYFSSRIVIGCWITRFRG